MENVAGTDSPFEAFFFIGFDDKNSRYVANLVTVFGGKFGGSGYGERDENDLTLTFEDSHALIKEQFTWDPDSKSWHIVSWVEKDGKKEQPHIDLTAKAAN
jgi:hypothetical protein